MMSMFIRNNEAHTNLCPNSWAAVWIEFKPAYSIIEYFVLLQIPPIGDAPTTELRVSGNVPGILSQISNL